MKPINVIGKRFGRLMVVGRSSKNSHAGALWDCVCDCGRMTVVTASKLNSGHTSSCGCLRVDTGGIINLKHGLSNKSKTYRSWKEMRQRCFNENSDKAKWYSRRGISVCERWEDYYAFLADMGDRPPGTTLDRIDSDGGYSPENCRWATPKQQAETNRGVFKRGMTPWNKGGLRTFEKVQKVSK